MKPFIKYCGGKTKLLKILIQHIPQNFNNYFELFCGGGSVFLELLKIQDSKTHEYNISDINEILMTCYATIKYNISELLLELSKDAYSNTKECYLANRLEYNILKFTNGNNIEKTSLFIYLNKCGYNGMYRENKKGEYNIPFGSMKNPKICDSDNLKDVSDALQDVNISYGDYQKNLDFIKENDFVYLDPPYDGTFTDYTRNIFGKDEQIKLKEFIDILTSKKVLVMLSNSSTDFIKELYKDYKQINITTSYSLGGKNANRGKIQELLILNY